MPHGNKSGMDNTKQPSPQNYELRELHEDRGDRMNNALNVLRQNDTMTGRNRRLLLRQNDIMTGSNRKFLHRRNDIMTKTG